MNKSKCNHLKSITHKMLNEPFIRRSINQKPNINAIHELMRRYINIYEKNMRHDWFKVY